MAINYPYSWNNFINLKNTPIIKNIITSEELKTLENQLNTYCSANHTGNTCGDWGGNDLGCKGDDTECACVKTHYCAVISGGKN